MNLNAHPMSEKLNRELAFFGKLTAACTHEMQNVLAIIRESAGLLEDLVSLNPEESVPHSAHIRKTVSQVQNQVGRGVELITRLNRFAHSPDLTYKKLNVFEEAELVVAMSQRFTASHLVTVSVSGCDGEQGAELYVKANPVHLQMVLFDAIQCCLAGLTHRCMIEIRIWIRGSELVIAFQCRGEEIPGWGSFSTQLTDAAEWKKLESTVMEMGGRLELEEDSYALQLVIPEYNAV